jgi:hypothetical protein
VCNALLTNCGRHDFKGGSSSHLLHPPSPPHPDLLQPSSPPHPLFHPSSSPHCDHCVCVLSFPPLPPPCPSILLLTRVSFTSSSYHSPPHPCIIHLLIPANTSVLPLKLIRMTRAISSPHLHICSLLLTFTRFSSSSVFPMFTLSPIKSFIPRF